jgi:hypothetical protein
LQTRLADKFKSDFYTESEGGSSADRKKHNPFHTSMKHSGLVLMEKTPSCVNVRVWHAGKKYEVSKYAACFRRVKAQLICAHVKKFGNEHMLCLYPHKDKSEQMIGEWRDFPCWTSKYSIRYHDA